MLVLRNEYSTFSRKADAKIRLLKDVLERVQRGENVDVEKVLGTGDEEQEQEWRDGKWLHELFPMAVRSSCLISVLRNLEEEGQTWQAKDRRRQENRPPDDQEAEVDDTEKAGETDQGNTSNFSKRPPIFY